MASPTQRTRVIRKKKDAGQGRKRKQKNRAQGTTKTAKELFGDK